MHGRFNLQRARQASALALPPGPKHLPTHSHLVSSYKAACGGMEPTAFSQRGTPPSQLRAAHSLSRSLLLLLTLAGLAQLPVAAVTDIEDLWEGQAAWPALAFKPRWVPAQPRASAVAPDPLRLALRGPSMQASSRGNRAPWMGGDEPGQPAALPLLGRGAAPGPQRGGSARHPSGRLWHSSPISRKHPAPNVSG